MLYFAYPSKKWIDDQFLGDKIKGNEKPHRITSMKNCDEKFSCSHNKKEGHDDDYC